MQGVFPGQQKRWSSKQAEYRRLLGRTGVQGQARSSGLGEVSSRSLLDIQMVKSGRVVGV